MDNELSHQPDSPIIKTAPRGVSTKGGLRRIGANRQAARAVVHRIIGSYESGIIRAYCRVRFLIMRVRFLEELDQYMPATGTICDLGCGFGLFSLYFASSEPNRRLVGVDLNAKRVATATQSAKRLDLENAEYRVGDAQESPIPDGAACVYMLDLLHHVPQDGVARLIRQVYEALSPGGTLLVKDVDTRPFYKRWFTLWLDRLMVGMEPIRYWSAGEMIGMLEAAGFEVFSHELHDILPYPHRLYICRKL